MRSSLVLFLWLAGIAAGFSAEIKSAGNGNWSSASTWVNGALPQAGDQVVIQHEVSIDQSTPVVGRVAIRTGAKLLAASGTWQLRVSGDIVNDGTLNLYSSPTAYADVVLSGDSYWQGPGSWTLAGVQVGAAIEWTFSQGLQFYINKDIQADETASVNDLFFNSNAEFIFTGSESSTVASSPAFFYPLFVVDKTAGAIVSLADSEGINVPQIWAIDLSKSTDVLNIGANNILEIYQPSLGAGYIQGSGLAASPSGISDNEGAGQDVLRIKTGRIRMDSDFEVAGDVILEDAVAYLDISGKVLRSSGTFSGDGWLISDETTSLSFLDIDSHVMLRFDTGSSIDLLEFDRTDVGGSSEVTLDGNLRIAGELRNSPPMNVLNFRQELEIAGNYTGAGKLGGGTSATLLVTGGGAGLVIPVGANGIFKQVQVSRSSSVTFTNSFQILDELNTTTPVRLLDGALTLGGPRTSPGRLTMVAGSSLDLGNGGIYFTGNAAISIPEGAFISGSDAAWIEFSGTKANASLRFDPDPLKSRLKSLVIGKTSSVITLESAVSVTGNVKVSGTSSTLNSNGFLSLVSTAAGSANVEPLAAGSKITGSVRVERYISGGPKALYRGYRMLSSPVYDHTTAFTTENRSAAFWQYLDDIYVTGPNPAGGFDVFPGNPNNATIWTYDETARSADGLDYVGINTINDALPAGRGAMIFFRGARTNIGGKLKAPYDNPEAVTLDYVGVLNQGPVTVSLSHTANGEATDGFYLLGNPYASTLDWNASGWVKSNITGQIWIYNPATKQYAIYDGVNGTNGGNQYIAPGQAFFVKTTGTGSITFNEAVKVSKTASQDFPLFMAAPVMAAHSADGPLVLNAPDDASRVRVRLVRDENSTDEALIIFRGGSKAGYTLEDARDMHGEQVYLSTLSADSIQLGINYMPPAATVDRIRIYASASAYGRYSLEFPELEISGQVAVFLWDRLLDKKVKLHAGTAYPFEISTEKGSYGSDRFQLVFERVKPPVSISAFSAKRSGNNVRLEWSAAAEDALVQTMFHLERSADGVNFTEIGQVPGAATGQQALKYSFLDKEPKPGSNSYRLKTLFSDGSETVSDILTLIFDLIGIRDQPSKMYPNPADTGITIYLDQIGKIQGVLNIYDKAGKKVVARALDWIGNGTEVSQPVSQLKQGIYFVEILDVNKNKQVFSSKLIKQ
ncbi:MAG TPA: T9SS type A sorting domain-containing protein [Sphingobacteriaceae bacterium]